MNYLAKLLHTRHSTRAFKPETVPSSVIMNALEFAQMTPSNCNVQPWRVFVVSGNAKDRLSEALLCAFNDGIDEQLDHPMEQFSGDYYDLQIACAMEMYGKMGIKRADRVGRRKAHARNFTFFDAPHVAVVCMDRSFGVGSALDIGMWIQTFLLALTSYGVQSCTQASLRSYPEVLRREIEIPSTLTPLCGISFGYEDKINPVNNLRKMRNSIEKNIKIIE